MNAKNELRDFLILFSLGFFGSTLILVLAYWAKS